MAARALWRWVCVTARWRFVLASRRQQRSHVSHPDHSAARHVQGKPHHCLLVIARLWRQSVGTVLLHPAKAFGFGSLRLVLATQWQQRGHAPLQVAALGFRGTSPLSPFDGRWATASQCTRRCCAPCRCRQRYWPVLRNRAVRALWRWVWATARCASRLAADTAVPAASGFARCGHPLRFYIRPYFVTWPPVGRVAPLVAATASPLRVTKTALCKVAYAGSGRVSRWRSPVAARPTRQRLSPYGCAGAWASVRRCAHRSGQWPAARHGVSAPPTPGPRRCAASARGQPVRPHGAPSVPRRQGQWGRRQGFMQALRACCGADRPAACALYGGYGRRYRAGNCKTLAKSSYIRRYIVTKEKGFAITFVTTNPYLYWCRRDESNTQPLITNYNSHALRRGSGLLIRLKKPYGYGLLGDFS